MPGSSGAGEDLEDGEIFDDDEPVEVFKGGGIEEKAPVPEIPPREQIFKNKGNSGGGDRKKGPKDNKRSNSNERRGGPGVGGGDNNAKRGDRGNRNNQNNQAAKRKRGRESEDEHRQPNKPKQRKTNEKNKTNQQPLDEEVDENEMVYVMGGNSPTAKPNDWDMISDEEDQDRESYVERGGGGRGRRGREGFHSSGRMSRRTRLGRGGLKRRFSRKGNNDLTICKFFMQGKCQRGNDCPFSHIALPSKKMELCKFYMNDCCMKRDKCLYMHGDFPCKFFHTGQKCYAGKRCKFYHGKISNFLRSVLMKHLENRELQSEFDKLRDVYEKKDRERGRERENNRFSDRRSEEEEGGNTPMPSPQRDEFVSDREQSQTPEREREKRERRRRRNKRRSREEEEGRRDFEEGKVEYYDEEHNNEGQNNDYDRYCEGNMDDYNNYSESNNYNNDVNDYANDEYPDEEQESDALPANMPKTQRKLFMRIQQQQQNKQSDQRPMEAETREEDFKEENWYSSDEDAVSSNNNPLNTIFRNVPGLQMNNPMNTMMNNQGPPPNQPPSMHMMPPPPMMSQPSAMAAPMPNMFANIDLSAVTKILSTVRESIQKKNEPNASNQKPPEPAPSSSPQHNNQNTQDDRRFRDPRLRAQESSDRNKAQGNASSKPMLPTPVLLTQADLDLRLSEPPPQTASSGSDVDLRHLPFKPAPLHQAANEIDASISSGPPLEYKLAILKPMKPDYASIASRSNPQTCANDPRLRKYATPQVLAQSQMVVAQAMPSGATRMMSPPHSVTSNQGPSHSPTQAQHSSNLSMNARAEEILISRDPRNRGVVANDPRRRTQPSPAAPSGPPLSPFGGPPQPFSPMGPPQSFAPQQPFGGPPPFDQPPQMRQDNDFRLGMLPHPSQQAPFLIPNITDIDLRIPHQPHYYQ